MGSFAGGSTGSFGRNRGHGWRRLKDPDSHGRSVNRVKQLVQGKNEFSLANSQS
jgi:hypothetical protein